MAKNFPYFKFIVTEWMTGDIVFEELSTQGLFINICAIYWQRDGNLSVEDINRRYKNPSELNELVNRFLIVENGFISIKFLDEQLIDANHISIKNSLNGAKGGRPKKSEKNPPLNDGLPPQSEKKQSKEEEELNKKKIKEELNKSLLSEIKISEDNFVYFKNIKIECSNEERINFKTAVWFQKLFIKNLKEKNAPTANQEKATYRNYVTPIRLMFDNDKVTQEQVKQAYDFLNSLEGEFWKKNILSTSTLREKISQILIQKNTGNGKQFTGTSKKSARFSVARAAETLRADAERKQREMENRNS